MSALFAVGATVSTSGSAGAAVEPRHQPKPASTTIDCHLNIQQAHPSSHVGGTINVVATIACTPVAAARLSLQVTLYKLVCAPTCRQSPYGATGSSVKYNAKSIQANSAGPCTSGQYFGVASGTVVAPPRYIPPTGSVSGSGVTLVINC